MINPSTILLSAFLVILLFAVPKKYFLLPFILGACFIPADQRIIIMDLDFTPLRILVLAGFLRMLVQERNYGIRWNSFDKIVFTWAICGALIYCIRWGNTKAFVNRSGVLLDICGLYWIFRKNITSWDDIRLNLKLFAVCSLFLAALVGWEWMTGRNPFALLGRVATIVREGNYRCQASFPHSIILGLFWATLVPLFISLARTEQNTVFYWAAIAAGVFMVIASASSTPIVVLAVVLFGIFGFKWRRHTRQVALCLLAFLTGVHIIMEAPLWHLISRVSIIAGSTGWHRYNLIRQAINHFGEWALIGCRSTRHWGWGMQDITNQYVLEGVRGGLLTLVLFVAMLLYAFKITLNISLKDTKYEQYCFSWCFFVTLLGHSVAFLGLSYFGQITVPWYMMLAIVGFLAEYRAFPDTAQAALHNHTSVNTLRVMP